MRSNIKGYFVDKALNNQLNKHTFHKLWTRRSTILSSMVGSKIEIYNGKQFISLKISNSMVGHKLGEFSFTRKIYQYKKGRKK